MTKTYRIILDVTADETDRLLDTEDLRGFLAECAATWETPFGEVVNVRVDGRNWDEDKRALEETPINADIAKMIWEGRSIQAIKELRANNEGMSLMQAKDLVDKWRANR